MVKVEKRCNKLTQADMPFEVTKEDNDTCAHCGGEIDFQYALNWRYCDDCGDHLMKKKLHDERRRKQFNNL